MAARNNKPRSKGNREAIADTFATIKTQLADNKPEPTSGTSLTGQETRTLEDRHEMRMSLFISEAARQATNRAMMAKCEAFYDSEQYDYEDAQELRDRGQNPVVYNEVKPTIDWLIGTERRSRVDFVVVAEGDSTEDSEDAISRPSC